MSTFAYDCNTLINKELMKTNSFFSKLAGTILVLILIYELVYYFLNIGVFSGDRLIGVIHSIFIDASWITFFILLIKASVKRSPIITPSIIAIVAFSMDLIAACVSVYFIRMEEYDWLIIDTLSIVSGVANCIYILTAVIAFFWLSKYFQKGSVLKAMSITIAVVTILSYLSNLFIYPWNIEEESMRNIVQKSLSIFWTIASFIPQIVFFFAFSKLKKE